MARAGALAYPIIAVNEADTKHLFDNRYGTGQSTHRRDHAGHQRPLGGQERGRLRLRLVRPRRARCGPRAWASQVIVTEVNPVRALEAVMDGLRVMPMLEAAPHRRHLHHRHRRHQRHRPGAPRDDEGRRDTRQLRPLRRGDQHEGAGGDGRGDGGRSGPSSRSSVSATASGCSSWARDG